MERKLGQTSILSALAGVTRARVRAETFTASTLAHTALIGNSLTQGNHLCAHRYSTSQEVTP